MTGASNLGQGAGDSPFKCELFPAIAGGGRKMQWYRTMRGRERLNGESELLAHEFPQMGFGFLNDGVAVVSGFIGPSEALRHSYYVAAEFPYTYGDGSRIRVYLPDEELPSDTPHVYGDGEICIEHNNFTSSTDVIDVLGWTIQWLILYEQSLETGRTW